MVARPLPPQCKPTIRDCFALRGLRPWMRARLRTLRMGIPAPLRHTRSTATPIAGTATGPKGGEQYTDSRDLRQRRQRDPLARDTRVRIESEKCHVYHVYKPQQTARTALESGAQP